MHLSESWDREDISKGKITLSISCLLFMLDFINNDYQKPI